MNKSPSLIQLSFLNISPNIQVNIAGRTKQISNIPIHIFVPPSGIAVITPRGPTSPQVPMPAPIGTFSIWKIHVAIGPVMADVNVGGIHIRGFFMILGICSIDVPNPCEMMPLQRFSLNDMTAKPTIWAQHPAVAAPAAIPERPIAIHKAALLIGSVKAIPTETDTTIPMMRGLNSVAFSMNFPKASMKALMPGPTNMARRTPLIITTDGVTRMSIFVSFDTNFPSSVLITAAT